MAEKRKTFSKKIRFEVFKRDHFKCQYCGRSAPDIILEPDHIIPVAEGGGNDLMNLITSCFDCNRGKGARLLTEDVELQKQKDQLAELSERREQLKFMVQWREELKGLNNETIEFLAKEIDENVLSPFNQSVNENGRKTIKKWLSKFTVNELLDAIEESARIYVKFTPNDIPKDNPFAKFWDCVPAIAFNKKKYTPEQYEKHNQTKYLLGIIRNRFKYPSAENTKIMQELFTKALDTGITFEKLKYITCSRTYMQEIYDEILELINDIEKIFHEKE